MDGLRNLQHKRRKERQMTKLYSVDIKLAATAYVLADSPDEAQAIVDETFGDQEGAELPTGDCGDFVITGEPFNPHMAPVSLSPMVTFYGRFDGQAVDLADGFGDEEGEE